MPDEFKYDDSIDTFTAYRRYINSKPWVSENYLRKPDPKSSVDKLERHSYDKIDGEWVISKTAILTYERIPYNIPMVAAIQKSYMMFLLPIL